MNVSEPTPSTVQSDSEPPTGDRDPATVRNGIVGSAVAVLLAFLPFSTVLGGAVAGYLTGSGPRDSTAAGLVAGLVAFVPYVVGGVLLLSSPAATLPAPVRAADPVVVTVLVAGWAVVYVLSMGAAGGLVGASIRRHWS